MSGVRSLVDVIIIAVVLRVIVGSRSQPLPLFEFAAFGELEEVGRPASLDVDKVGVCFSAAKTFDILDVFGGWWSIKGPSFA